MNTHHDSTLIVDSDDFTNAPVFCLQLLANLLRQKRAFPHLFNAATSAVSVISIEHNLEPIIDQLSAPIVLPEDLPEALTNELSMYGLDDIPQSPRPRLRRISPEMDLDGIDLAGILSVIDDMLADDSFADRSVVFKRNAAFAARVLGLDKAEQSILGIVATLVNARAASSIYKRIFARTNSMTDTVAAMMNIESNIIKDHLAPSAPLMRNGILQIERNFDNMPMPVLLDTLEEVMCADLDGPDDLIVRLLGAPEKAKLEADDFEHLADDLKTLTRVLSNATSRGVHGINILLYGRPGTGKTEFSRLLAAKTGLPLYASGKADSDGREPTRHERLNSYLMLQRLMAESNRSGICLFDEADDIFGNANPFTHRAPGSKLFTNGIFENNVAPTIWIVNDHQDLPESIRRRMNHTLHVDLPPASVREHILGKICQRHDLKLGEAEISGLAKRFPVPPAVYDKMAQSTRLGEGGLELADKVLTGLCETLGVLPTSRPGAFVIKPFLPEISCAEIDLVDFSERLAGIGSGKGFSMCLYGVPGTGKSAFAAHVAEQLGLEVEKIRASDILAPYVGQSEANIRSAFARAVRDGSFLIIDEADSLLRNRGAARQTWEITQVNELLVAMEQHPLPFACTTNMMESLDPAAMRRFTFGVRFNTLTPRKAKTCFHHYFGMTPPPALTSLSGLVPADFAVVSRRAEILGGANDCDRLMAMLGDELTKRGKTTTPSMGFNIHRSTRTN